MTQALAIDVDDPGHVAQALEGGVRDGLPHVALVELGVADEGDEARRALTPEVRLDVAAGHGGEERRNRTEAHGAGREVGDVRVLRTRRVGLEAAEGTEPGEVRTVELAGQVLDGVVHGRRVRLHRDLVVAAEVTEPERGHDPDHRGRAGLMTADLHVALRTVVVGVVHDPDGQPQHPLLDGLERRQLDRRGPGHGVHHLLRLGARRANGCTHLARPRRRWRRSSSSQMRTAFASSSRLASDADPSADLRTPLAQRTPRADVAGGNRRP
jgi:hypothetical protein